MALFTDGLAARLEDLHGYESGILDLASAEGIDITGKIRIAQRELGTELIPFLGQAGFGEPDLSSIVVTDALLDAVVLRALALVYRDVYQSRMNDRYEGKWREYVAQSERAMRRLLDAGIGVTSAPVAKAALPSTQLFTGGLLPTRTYYVRIAWTRGSTVTGALSDAVLVSIEQGSKIAVQPPAMPWGLSGWLLYAGTTPTNTLLQTECPIGPGLTWTEPDNGLRTDLPSWPVQKPDYYLLHRREILRG